MSITTGQIDAIATLVREVLGGAAVGAYLHGSAVLGGLRPRSDIDVLAVSSRRLTPDERRVLRDGLLRISASGGPSQPRPVELTIVVDSDVRPWRYPPRAEFQYGEWLRGDYESGMVPSAEPESADLAPLITMALLGDRPVFGPPPAQVLDPVPHGDLIRAIVGGIPGLMSELETDTRNVLLTLARIWTTVATGSIRTKDDAATWALDRLAVEHRAVLARARSIYLGEEEERWDDLAARVRPHADHVVARIAELRRA
jgi:predicted nucleotidyltransferase